MVAALSLLAMWAIASLIGPAPPKTVRIAGGAPGGAYVEAAEGLAQALREVGVAADVVTTAGSQENLTRLHATDETAVDIALVQSGLRPAQEPSAVMSLGALFLEPVWLFTRGAGEGPDVQSLAGLRLAAGAEGSGARALADRLLEENGLGAGAVTLIPVSGEAAVAAVRAGEADAALVVASPRAAWIRELVALGDVRLAPFDRAPAYQRRHPFLASTVLRRGVLDPAADLPRQDVPLLAATAQLVVRSDLHPAIQSVLLEAAQTQFSGGDALSAPRDFPNPHMVDLALSDEAERYYARGPSVLRRYLPYWAANIIERAWMILLPLAVLASPLIRSAPPVYRWRTRRKIYLWYRDLRELEERGRAAKTGDERTKVRAELAALQGEAGRIAVPEAYTDELYRLREHIQFVDTLLAAQAT